MPGGRDPAQFLEKNPPRWTLLEQNRKPKALEIRRWVAPWPGFGLPDRLCDDLPGHRGDSATYWTELYGNRYTPILPGPKYHLAQSAI